MACRTSPGSTQTSSIIKKLKKSAPGSREYEVNDINLKTFNGILQRTIREAKRMFYHNSFEESRNNPRKSWKTLNSLLNRNNQEEKLPEFLRVNGEQITSEQRIVNALNLHFSTIGSKLASSIENTNDTFATFMNNPPNVNFSFEQVSIELVASITDKLQPKNSSADDGISTKLIKHLKDLISRPLTFLINQSLSEGRFPDILKTARVKSLFKKGDKHDPNNYRPISILPSVSKVFEKVMHNQIVNFFHTNNLFYESQYGFRAKHSTELAVLELVDRLSKSMDLY
jgi:hypothetical protein